MKIPNPISTISEKRTDRTVDKVRKKHKTSLESKKKRHSSTKERDGLFLVLGLAGYLGTAILGAYLDDVLIYLSGFGVLIGFVGLTWIMSLWQQWNLKSKLTITMNVVPNDPENSRAVRLRFEGVKFGTALESPKELIEYVHTQGAHLTHAFTSEKNGEAKRVFEEMEEEMKKHDEQLRLYPMITKKDSIPTFLQLPHHYDEELMAEETSVRLSYGRGKIRHAEITVFECDPIKTSIRVKDKIIDVEYSLYTLYSSQKKMEDHQRGALWHTPTRVAQEVANHTKQNIDVNQNESYFAIIEKQRDDAVQGRKKLQIQKDLGEMNVDLDGDMRIRTDKAKAPYEVSDLILWLIVAFGAGCALTYIFMGG